MKKKYSLNYDIERDIDRLHAVEEILDSLTTKPSPSELEQMASYILYGKDEEGKNAVQRGETTDSDKRYKNFQRAADKIQSLDDILDNPLTDQQTLKPLSERYIYKKTRPSIKRPKNDDPGDSDVPGMQELWERIDYLDHVLAANTGQIEPDESVSLITDPYRLYQFKHMLIDIKRHQYYLKESYKPTLHFLSCTPPKTQFYNWDNDSFYWISEEEWRQKIASSYLSRISRNLDDYETRWNEEKQQQEIKWVVRRHTFNWEDPAHIRALITYYSAIYMEMYDRLDSWGRTLIYDFNRYFDMCHFSEVREYILLRRIDKISNNIIAQEVQEKFGLKYNENHICTILSKEIPEKMAKTAAKHRLLLETPQEERKRCFRCGRWLPRHNLFFVTNNNRADHFSSNCKECEKKRRIEKGGQTEHDRRNKETQMHEMSARKTNS